MRFFLFALSSFALALSGCMSGDDPTETATSEIKTSGSGIHFVGTPTCVDLDGTLECTGTLAGLGNAATTVVVTVERICINRGQQQPPGLVTGTETNIQPENGQIMFDVTVSADCPDQMEAQFVSPATITVSQGNQTLFTGTIAF
jgi:hypothetical protein